MMKSYTNYTRAKHWLLVLPFVILTTGCDSIAMGPMTVDPNVRIVSFGDSTTDGPSDKNYDEFLPELLNEPANTFSNQGNGGENTTDGLVRLTGLLDSEVFPNANTLLFWQGGNDVSDFIKDMDPLLLRSPDDDTYPFRDELTAQLDTAQANIESAIASAQAAGYEVFVATYFFIPDAIFSCDALLFDLIIPGQARNANAYMRNLNDRIRLAAASQGATLVDIATLDDAMRSTLDNYEDCNHLSEMGNEIAAQLFADTLGLSIR